MPPSSPSGKGRYGTETAQADPSTHHCWNNINYTSRHRPRSAIGAETHALNMAEGVSAWIMSHVESDRLTIIKNLNNCVSYRITKAHRCVGLDVGLTMTQISDLKAKKIAPGGKPMADGTIPGLRLESGSAKGHGKWIPGL